MAHDPVSVAVLKLLRWQLHELDRSPIGVPNVNHAFAGIRTSLECLRSSSRFPTRRGYFLKNGIEIIDRERNMDRSDIARAKIDMFLAISGREIFEQFDFVSAGRFHDREFDLCAWHARDLTRHLACLMGAM